MEVAKNIGYTFAEDKNFSFEGDSSDNFEEAKYSKVADLSRQNPVAFVKLADIMDFIQAKCTEVNEVLDTQDDESIIILNHYKWNKSMVGEDWFGNEHKLRKKIGLEPNQKMELEDFSELKCPGCFVSKPKEKFDSLKCNHFLCKDCWADYIQYNITSLDKPFFWKCLIDGCNMVVPDSFNQRYMTDETRPQYQKKMATAYTNNSKSFRWCPIKNCQYGVEVTEIYAQPIESIECRCGQVYCFKCGLESHRPCTCEIADQWITHRKNNDTVLFNKSCLDIKDICPCPKCDKPAKKYNMSDEMQCLGIKCNYNFCPLCLQKWKLNHFCSQYEMIIELKNEYDAKLEKMNENAKRSCAYLEAYKGCEKAFEDIDIKFVMKKLNPDQGDNTCKEEILENGYKASLNAKRIQKWCYVYLLATNDRRAATCESSLKKLNSHVATLQKSLEQICEDTPYVEYQQHKKTILSAEKDCKRLLEVLLDEIIRYGDIADDLVIKPKPVEFKSISLPKRKFIDLMVFEENKNQQKKPNPPQIDFSKPYIPKEDGQEPANCSKCGLESHTPCTCETARQWILHRQNGDVILFNKSCLDVNDAYPCPKCDNFAKRRGMSDEMQCLGVNCDYNFCPLCLEKWELNHFCGRYEASLEQKNEYDAKLEQMEENVKRSCAYLKAYESHGKAYKEMDVESMIKKLPYHSNNKGQEGPLENGYNVVLKAKRVQKWCYVYLLATNTLTKDDLRGTACEALLNKLDSHISELQKSLEPFCKGIAYPEYEQHKKTILSAEHKCRCALDALLDKIIENADVANDQQ